MNHPEHSEWVILAIFIGLVAWTLIVFSIKPRTRRLGFKTPLKCPTCGSDKIDIRSSAFCSDKDAGGKLGAGFMICEYGICKQCGGRCARYHENKVYVPSEKEWTKYMAENELAE